jgi:hypothetical protein
LIIVDDKLNNSSKEVEVKLKRLMILMLDVISEGEAIQKITERVSQIIKNRIKARDSLPTTFLSLRM